MRVLLIDNEPAAARAVGLMLSNAGFNVEATLMGEEGIDMSLAYAFDAILLDLSLDDMCGFEVLRELRSRRVQTPVLIVSGARDVESKVRALAAGADDYLVKPIHKDELSARIRAVVRRAAGHSQSVISVGELSVNLDGRTVHVCGERVHLTTKEFQMLELLALRRGKTVAKDAFLSSLYGGLEEPGPKIIDVFICKLRQKLAAASNGGHFIETVWGGGYVLRDPETMAAKAA